MKALAFQDPFGRDRLEELSATYRRGLLDDVLPFWFPRSLDPEHGGFIFNRDRDGSLLDTDKGMWQHYWKW